MNSLMDIEELLRGSLQREADRTGHEPTPVEHVEWNARRLRRTQRAKQGAIGLVAAAAVVTPVAFYGGSLVADRPDRAEPDPSLFASLTRGDAPDVDWIEGTTYHGRSGFDADVPVPDLESFVSYRGGLLVTTPTQVIVLDDTGSVVSDECGSPSIAQDEAGETVLTATVPECNDRAQGVTLRWSSVTGSVDLPKNLTPNGWSVDPVAVRGDHTFLNTDDGGYRLVTALGPPERVPGIATIADVTADGRWLAGTTDDGRSVVADARSGEVRTRLEGSPLAFSPDGGLVAVVSDEYGLMVLDAGSGNLLGMTGTSVMPDQVAWESSDTVLAITEEGQREAIVRYSPDDGVSLASDPSSLGTLALVDQP